MRVNSSPIGISIKVFAARFTAGAARAILPSAGRSPCGRLVRAGRQGLESPAARAHPRTPADRPFFTAVPGKGPMGEDECLEMVRTVAEAHAGLREIALRLRRRLPAKAAAARAARSSRSSGYGGGRSSTRRPEKPLETAPEAPQLPADISNRTTASTGARAHRPHVVPHTAVAAAVACRPRAVGSANIVGRRPPPANQQSVQFSVATNEKFTVATNMRRRSVNQGAAP